MAAPSVTVVAPINIAFIKYWGKRAGGEELILPTNDSFSITLSTSPFRTKTSIVLTDKVAEDSLWLNGEQVNVAASKRLQHVLQKVRATSPAHLAKLKAVMVSENNFPTAAGMASSAAGFCALSFGLVRVFQSTCDVSLLARIGSGSALRSAYGGFVRWQMGVKADGSDCVAQQFADHNHWPEMQVLCVVVKGKKKDVSSTKGMQMSVQTSPMMKERIEKIVPARMKAIMEAIKNRDFDTFAQISMEDSDDLQAVCRTTTPPLIYATDDSFAMIDLLRSYNAVSRRRVVGYTFDAGANCFVFTLKPNLPEVVALILHHFPTPPERCCFNDTTLLAAAQNVILPASCTPLINYPKRPLTWLLHSPVGSGPSVLPESESLIDAATLTPAPQRSKI